MAELIKNENSYISLEEANALVENSYISSSDEYKWWNALSDSDKAVLVLSSTRMLNNDVLCGWRGYRVDEDQSLSFPRKLKNGTIVEWTSTMSNGLIELLFEVNKNSYSEYERLRKQGVSSYKIKDASISFMSQGRSVDNNINFESILDHNNILKAYFADYSIYIY